MSGPTVLVVDDEPMNHEVIHAFLEGEGYSLIEAHSGTEAIATAKRTPPDLVLLDVMMPGINGFETAALLKAQAGDEYLPIIFVTALDDHGSRVEGLKAQADEFLTKPIDRLELVVRVSNLLSLRAQRSALLLQNTQHVELHRFKDDLSSMIVHDLKNPMSAVLANLSYVLAEPGNLDQSQREALQDAQTSSERAVHLINNLLDVARLEASRFELKRSPTALAPLVAGLVQQRVVLARGRGISVSLRLDPAVHAELDADLITRVIENLLDNAFRHTPTGGTIQALVEASDGEAVVRIGNTGRAIPRSAREMIFEKFGQAGPNRGRMNLGLGLYFCRLAAEAHGGRISLEETAAFPAVFSLALPRQR